MPAPSNAPLSARLFPPTAFAWWETALMRAGFVLVLYSVYPKAIGFRSAPFPNGLAHFSDLTWLAEPQNFRISFLVFLAGAAGYLIGVAPFLSLTAMLVPFVLTATLINSQGAISHYFQLLALILAAQWVYALSFLLRGGTGQERLGANPTFQSRLAAIALQIIAANYMLSGITKLIETQGAWLWQSQYMPVQYEKIRLQNYFGTLGPDTASLGGQLSRLCLDHPWLCIFFYGPGLFVELCAPLMLLGRKWSFWTGIVILLMHRLVAVTMDLEFTQHEWVILIFAVNPPYWIGRLLGKVPEPEPVLTTAAPLVSWSSLGGLRWFLASIILGLGLGENFPFSNWPMYSSFRPRATLVYIESAEGTPIASRAFGGLSAPRMKKIAEKYFKTESAASDRHGLPKETAKQRGAEKSLGYFKGLATDPVLLANARTLTLVELTIRMEKNPKRKLLQESQRLATVSAK